MWSDSTSNIERDVQTEQKPKFKHLTSLFAFAFSSAKVISCIYLVAFVILSLFRLLLSFVWGKYIQEISVFTVEKNVVSVLFLILGYAVINFLVDLISRYVIPREEIERLDIVQINRQEELMHSKMYQKIASISPEYFEIAKINDTIEQVFSFVGNRGGDEHASDAARLCSNCEDYFCFFNRSIFVFTKSMVGYIGFISSVTCNLVSNNWAKITI